MNSHRMVTIFSLSFLFCCMLVLLKEESNNKEFAL